MERYTDVVDEKHPLVYRVIELEERPKPKRPLWRRFVRVILTILVLGMVWSTVAPFLYRNCSKLRDLVPEHPIPPYLSLDLIPLDSETDPAMSDIPLQHYTFSRDLKSFWLRQDSFHGITRTEVVGNVIVHSCEKASNISAHFKFEVSDDSLLDKIEVIPRNDGILFKLDPFSIVQQTVNATIWLVIPKGGKYDLDGLRIGTTQLNIWLKDTFTTPVNSSYISSVSGSVTSFGRAAKDTGLEINNLEVSTVSGEIRGEYPLNHALSLGSTSGDIDAEIASAFLEEEKAWFKTGTVSGSTTARFVSDLHTRPLYSKHNSVSGDVTLYYPEDWQGGLKLETTSGNIDVEGKGTTIVKKEKDIVGKYWKVLKGDGKSRGFIGTVSGAIKVIIGDE
ncbi:hypothetical protein ABW19_dt0203770 [Dactylella cylindrospora]|nr:hypothetical protein ABW19_dt0203770 [Dactylella cylindrospora]